MLAGLPADVANGTNRVGIILQSAAAARTFQRGGAILDRATLPWLILPTLIGAGAGAALAAYMPADLLEPLLLGVLVFIAFLIVLVPSSLRTPGEGVEPRSPRRTSSALMLVGAGFYGGFIQAGVGFVLLTILGGALRFDLVRANLVKVLIVAALTTVALAIFIADGLVEWVPGLILGVASVAGAWIAARLATRRAGPWLRWVVLLSVVVSAVAVALR